MEVLIQSIVSSHKKEQSYRLSIQKEHRGTIKALRALFLIFRSDPELDANIDLR